MMSEQEKIIKIAEFYKQPNQLIKTIEECSELIQVCCKLRQVEYFDSAEKYENLLKCLSSEIADVEIMIVQLKYLFSLSEEVEREKKNKLYRQLKRIGEIR